MEELRVESLKMALRSTRDAAKGVRDEGWRVGSEALRTAIDTHIDALAHSCGLAPGLDIQRGIVARDCDRWSKLYRQAQNHPKRGEFQEDGMETARRLIERTEALLAALPWQRVP